MALQPKLRLALVTLLSLPTLLLTSCGNNEVTEHRILVIYDVTGTLEGSLPTAEKIMADLKRLVNSEPQDGLMVSVARIDDISGQQASQLTLAADRSNAMTGNIKKRERQVKEFYQKTRELINTSIAGSELDKGKSKIYSKVCRSINNLRSSNAKHYTLIYSDMMENSELASFYNAEVLAAAASDPKAYANKHMTPSCELGDLSTFLISLYPYRTPQNDATINEAETFWSGLLASKGAAVAVDR